MKKTRREFFEVFRRVPEEKEPTTWWRKNAESAPADEPAADGPVLVKPLTRRETAATPPNKVVLTLSRELLVVIAVAMVLSLVGAFVWGHSLGHADSARVAVGPSPAPDAAKTPALAVATPAQPALPYYTLRLQMRNVVHQNAERIAADLCAQGYDAFPLQLDAASWSVNIGRFADYRSKDAEALKKQVNSLMYKNQRLLCSWAKVIK